MQDGVKEMQRLARGQSLGINTELKTQQAI